MKKKSKSPERLKKTQKLKLVSSLPEHELKGIDAFKSQFDNDSSVDWLKTTKWKCTPDSKKSFKIYRVVRFKQKDNPPVTERFDKYIFKHFESDRKQCEEVCRILNYRYENRQRAREAWLIKSDFIKKQGSELSLSFEEFIRARSDNKKHALSCRRMIENHFLNYFYHERSVPLYDYLEWHSLKVQAEYIEYLFNKRVNSTRMGSQVHLSVKTIKAVIQNINLFFKFLHVESDGHIPALKFTFPSVTDARFSKHANDRKKNLSKQKIKQPSEEYISEEDFNLIMKSAPEKIRSAIWIAYKFGLRRSEILALETSNIKKGYLSVSLQLLSLQTERDDHMKRVRILKRETGSLKNKKIESRKIPYWFATPEETYKRISEMYVCHPSVLSGEWIDLMKKLGMKYTFHNLRNAFCTNALRDAEKFGIAITDVQLALGHTDLRTTMKYFRDYRKFEDDEQWTPEVG